MEDRHGEKYHCECVHSTCRACIIVVQVSATWPSSIVLVVSGPTVAVNAISTLLLLSQALLTTYNFRNSVFLSRVQPILYVILNPYLRLKYDAISTEMITVSIVKSF